MVEKPIPKVTTEALQTLQEVPQMLIEEQLVEVPQVQIAEIIKQVPKVVVQPRQRQIPRVTTQVVEKVQQVGVPLINEVAIEVPSVQQVEVMKQTAQLSQQRMVQTSRQYEVATQAFRTMPEERAGVFQAQAIAAGNVSVQPTAVERINPVMVGYESQPLQASVAPTI